jgi:ribosomal protein S20
MAGLAISLVAAALIGGTLIQVVAAASAGRPTSTPATADEPTPRASAAPRAKADEPSEYCLAFRAALAANLKVTEAELVTAVKAAIATAIDKAAADGDVPAAAAERAKAKVAAADGDGCGLLAGRRGAVVKAALGVGRDALDAAARALGMTASEVRGDLRQGMSLKDISVAQGVPYETVSAAVLAAVKTDVDAAVAAGTIKQARADRILARITARLEAGWPGRAR